MKKLFSIFSSVFIMFSLMCSQTYSTGDKTVTVQTNGIVFDIFVTDNEKNQLNHICLTLFGDIDNICGDGVKTFFKMFNHLKHHCYHIINSEIADYFLQFPNNQTYFLGTPSDEIIDLNEESSIPEIEILKKLITVLKKRKD